MVKTKAEQVTSTLVDAFM